MKDSGEIGAVCTAPTPKGKLQEALRQKDRVWTKLRKASELAPTKQFPLA